MHIGPFNDAAQCVNIGEPYTVVLECVLNVYLLECMAVCAYCERGLSVTSITERDTTEGHGCSGRRSLHVLRNLLLSGLFACGAHEAASAGIDARLAIDPRARRLLHASCATGVAARLVYVIERAGISCEDGVVNGRDISTGAVLSTLWPSILFFLLLSRTATGESYVVERELSIAELPEAVAAVAVPMPSMSTSPCA